MRTKLRLVCSITILLFCFSASSQENYWETVGVLEDSGAENNEKVIEGPGARFRLNFNAFSSQLRSGQIGPSTVRVQIPTLEHGLQNFSIRETPVLAPELSARYPLIKSYTGVSVKNPGLRVRFSISHRGFQAMLIDTKSGKIGFIQQQAPDRQTYGMYLRDSETSKMADFLCGTESVVNPQKQGSAQKLVDDQVLRKYRLAVSATGEYTEYHGGTVADALGAINATITRVNEVMETDLAITLEVIANNDLIIFTDADTDPYGGNLNVEVQNELTSTIGELNYDIGHLFHKANNSGNAGFIGSVCIDSEKGSAFSSAVNPVGDIFDLDFVAHEMGHQFGANHTWSFESEGTQVQAEPGSGSTIMGYAGITGANNVVPNGDDYYHYNSIVQITQFVQGTSCAEQIALTNAPPVITPIPDYAIPIGTAFVLSANATDPDPGDVLTYTWEQIDDGVVSNTTFGPTQPSGANFRSLPPSQDSDRYFPKLSEVLQGNLTQTNPTVNSAWETVSNVRREFNFALTVRDNASGGGQVASELVKINVFNTGGPFEVTSQASSSTFEGGSVQTVTWDVADTHKNPINSQEVDIWLSLDGGNSFSVLLADNVPNDGTQEVQLPGTATTQARIMVKASESVFFALNTADFEISESEVVLQLNELRTEVCQPNNAVVNFEYQAYGGFSELSTFSVSGLPAGLNATFSPTTASANNTAVTLNIANTNSVAAGTYTVNLLANSSSNSETVSFALAIGNTNFSEVALLSPTDNATDISLLQELIWAENPLYTSYDLEIATDPGFTTIIESATVLIEEYAPQNLLSETTYYWRVRPNNFCGTGTFGTPFSFTTVALNCTAKSASGLPLTISSSGTPTITSTISFVDNLSISDVNVNLDIDHSFLADLIIKLQSPAGTEVILTANSCGSQSDINALFDDDASPFTCGGSPGISGTVKPLGSLAAFNGESTLGTWTLIIEDTAAADGGALNTFTLELCVEGNFRPDDDGDGVFDDGDDLCLGTPPGTEVNTDGCPVYRFPQDNFIIEINGETCRANNDGVLMITAEVFLDYSVSISGNGIDVTESFNDVYSIEDLQAGTYNVCITGTDGSVNFETQCFEVIIAQPELLSVLTSIDVNARVVTLELSGAEDYTVVWNGTTERYSGNTVILNLKNGKNTVMVTTNLPCQGSFEESYFITVKPILYPNPFRDEINAIIGSVKVPLNIRIFTYHGKLLRESVLRDGRQEVSLDVFDLPAGMYIIQLQGPDFNSTYKVIKQ